MSCKDGNNRDLCGCCCLSSSVSPFNERHDRVDFVEFSLFLSLSLFSFSVNEQLLISIIIPEIKKINLIDMSIENGIWEQNTSAAIRNSILKLGIHFHCVQNPSFFRTSIFFSFILRSVKLLIENVTQMQTFLPLPCSVSTSRKRYWK